MSRMKGLEEMVLFDRRKPRERRSGKERRKAQDRNYKGPERRISMKRLKMIQQINSLLEKQLK